MTLAYRALLAPVAAQDLQGNYLPGRSFTVYSVDDLDTPVSVYAAAEGGTALSSGARVADAKGNLTGFYVDIPGQYLIDFDAGFQVCTQALQDTRDIASPTDITAASASLLVSPAFTGAPTINGVAAETTTGAQAKATAARDAAIGAADTAAAARVTTLASLAALKQPIDPDLTAIAGLDSGTAGALVTDGAGWIRKTYAQLKTALALVKADVGLGNVDNTADANKPVSTAQAAADALRVPLIPEATGKAVTAYGTSWLATDVYTTSALGFTLSNRGVSGTMVANIAMRAIGTAAPYTPGTPGGVVILDVLHNNACKQKATTRSLNGVRQSMRALIWRLRAESVTEQASFTETFGTWTNNTLADFSGGSNRQSITVNAQYTVAVATAGDYGLVAHCLDDSAGWGTPAPFTVALNGVTVATAVAADFQMKETSGGAPVVGYSPIVIPIRDVPPSSTITVTATGPGGPLVPLYADALFKASTRPPLVILIKCPRLGAAAYTAGGVGCDDTDVDAYNLQLEKVAAEFPAGHVFVLDPDAAGFIKATHLGADGLHLSVAGSQFYTDMLTAALRENAHRVGFMLPSVP